jgi:hypothetical protein
LNPKQQLQARSDFKEIASTLNSPRMDMCCEVAMLTFTENLPEANDAQSAMAYHHQLSGAKRYLRTLRGLASLAPERKIDNSGSLNHNA